MPSTGVVRSCRLCNRTEEFRDGRWVVVEGITRAIGEHLHHWVAPANGPYENERRAFLRLIGGYSTSWGARDA